MSKENKTVVMRVTPDEAAKLRYQRKFDKAWAKEQLQGAAFVASITAARQAIVAGMSRQPNVLLFPPGWEPVALGEGIVSLGKLQGRACHSIILDELGEVAQ